MAGQFHFLDDEMIQLVADLTKSIGEGIDRINVITSEIANLNSQIVGLEARSTANDLRDIRNSLVAELAGLLDIKTFEQANGSLTVITGKGCVLAQGDGNFNWLSAGRRVRTSFGWGPVVRMLT